MKDHMLDPDASSDTLQRSITHTAGQLQAQLDELLQQKARTQLRLRSLRRRLSILQDPPGRKKLKKQRRPRNIAGQRESRKLRQFHEDLMRACRIAFLELGGTAKPHELCSAIIRRGSFSFEAIKTEPVLAVIRMLTSMAHRGEAICIASGSEQNWRLNT